MIPIQKLSEVLGLSSDTMYLPSIVIPSPNAFLVFRNTIEVVVIFASDKRNQIDKN